MSGSNRYFDTAAALELHDRQAALDAHRNRHRDRPVERDGERICLDCDEPIDPRRVERFPEAARCIGCQEIYEVRTGAGC